MQNNDNTNKLTEEIKCYVSNKYVARAEQLHGIFNVNMRTDKVKCDHAGTAFLFLGRLPIWLLRFRFV